MVASTVTLLAPGLAISYPNTIVRPSIVVDWTGGVGPFDVEYIWDTDPTFANGGGNRQIVTNTSVTATDTGVPTADLAVLTDGTTWYVQATVIDQGDAGATLADDRNFVYFDPIGDNRHLYLISNVGVAFLTTDTPKETQLVANNATSGSFTLSFDGQGPTASITYNDTKASVEAKLEALSNISDVEVYKLSPQAWVIRFVSTTADPIPLLTATDTLTGGSTSISAIIDDASPWGTGGTVAADGDPIDGDRVLYVLANVGVGFSTDAPSGGWGTGGTVAPDGDTRDDFARYLYQLANVDSTQPTPFIFRIEPTVARIGDSIRIYGQGLVSATFPTADAYGAEVRLYASPGTGGSYVLMPISNYISGESEDIIDVTVPVGAEVGTFDYVTVVHTLP